MSEDSIFPKNLYIVFEAASSERFEALRRAFQQFQSDKEGGIEREARTWRSLFDHRAVSHFWWPTEREAQEYFAMPESEQTETRWCFQDMIDAIYTGEYSLVSCEAVGQGKSGAVRGRLEFSPWAWPFGSCEALMALVNAFDGSVTEYDCGWGLKNGSGG